MTNLNKFSIIIPALNEESYIEKCLEALQNQDYQGEFEIIVVDNGSTDRTSAIAESYGVKVLREPVKGISNALIKGCSNAQGDILTFTDADTIVPSDWLSAYNSVFSSDEKIVAAGGLFLFFEKRFLARVIFNKILKPVLLLILERLIQPKYPTLSCANMAVRKSDYEKIGGFDPNMKWGQEIDLVKRLKREGRILFDKDIVVHTSCRRYSGEKRNGPVALLRSMRELVITIYRGMAMQMRDKTFPAQEEIRKK